MLTVGIIAYSRRLARWAVRAVAEADQTATIVRRTQDAIHMSDGTRYVALPLAAARMDGWRVDQLVFVDDRRWSVFHEQARAIEFYRRYCMSQSFAGLDVQEQRFVW